MKNRKKLGLWIIGLSVVLSMMGLYFYQMFMSPNFLVSYTDSKGKEHIEDSVWISIPDDTSFTFKQLSDFLYDQKVLHDRQSFAFVAKFMGYQDKIKPGQVCFRTNWSNLQAVRALRLPQKREVKMSFISVRLKDQLPEPICKNLYRAEDITNAFQFLINDSVTCAEYGFNTTTIACMFIPNTYQVFFQTNAADLLKRIKSEYDTFWNKDRVNKAGKLGLTKNEVSVLASIVQSETAKNDEKPRVAGVYINRLNKGMILQADPTVKFALYHEMKQQRITPQPEKDLTIKKPEDYFLIKRILHRHIDQAANSPYNTYTQNGLPPGPICIPDASSIDAVLNYEMHDYIYFCAKEDFSGYHNFARNLREHNRNAAAYQKALNEKGF